MFSLVRSSLPSRSPSLFYFSSDESSSTLNLPLSSLNHDRCFWCFGALISAHMRARCLSRGFVSSHAATQIAAEKRGKRFKDKKTCNKTFGPLLIFLVPPWTVSQAACAMTLHCHSWFQLQWGFPLVEKYLRKKSRTAIQDIFMSWQTDGLKHSGSDEVMVWKYSSNLLDCMQS